MEFFVRAPVTGDRRDDDVHRRVVFGGLHDRVDDELLVPLEDREQAQSHSLGEDEPPRRPGAAAVDAAPADLIRPIDRLASRVEEADHALGTELPYCHIVRGAHRARGQHDLSLHVLPCVVGRRIAAPDVDNLCRYVAAPASRGDGRGDVAVAGEEAWRARLRDPHLAHLGVPLLRAEREAFNVDVTEAVFLRRLFRVGGLTVGLARVLLGGPVALVRTHFEHMVARLRTRDARGDRVQRRGWNERARVGLHLCSQRTVGGCQRNQARGGESDLHQILQRERQEMRIRVCNDVISMTTWTGSYGYRWRDAVSIVALALGVPRCHV